MIASISSAPERAVISEDDAGSNSLTPSLGLLTGQISHQGVTVVTHAALGKSPHKYRAIEVGEAFKDALLIDQDSEQALKEPLLTSVTSVTSGTIETI